MTRRVIIDTDPGLDDAVAILFALVSRRFDVVGLTTVAGNIGIDAATRNSGRLLAALGYKNVPVIAGATKPLIREAAPLLEIHGADGLGGLPLPEPRAQPLRGAAWWMAERLLEAPAATIDILALGPLTNLAQLLAKYPEAARRIGRVFAMGGALDEPGNIGKRSEFNFAVDPEAVQAVLSGELDLTLVPLDVTRRVRVTPDQIGAMQGTPAGDLAGRIIELYFGSGRASRPLHDPCVMLLAAEPSLFDLEEHRLAVELGDGAEAGALMRSDDGALVKIAMRADAPRAIKMLTHGLQAH